ncbi:MAG: hypothetical protein GXO63_00330 [Candidatus Micrarchaeota archaeon]|nr:hypothetical protein [Candidatus Micrarchaeota archaeon]
MDDIAAYRLLKKYGIPVANMCVCKSESSVKKAVETIGFPCVMKVSASGMHKTDVGGVVTDVISHEQALKVFKKLMKIKGVNAVIIQEQLKGPELLVGGIYDETFGPCVSFGSGGRFAEALDDVSFRACPIDEKEAARMVSETRISRIFSSPRGRKYRVGELYRIISAVSTMMVKSRLRELDINPLFATERGFLAADVRITRL